MIAQPHRPDEANRARAHPPRGTGWPRGRAPQAAKDKGFAAGRFGAGPAIRAGGADY